ncbi:MAG TPA: PRC-barrel domain-containing protein, partial [Gemmatimonadaceae bacterium]|nr:PRC-barrel domain-containing protein [Gemmatimonadaceae bacterium]
MAKDRESTDRTTGASRSANDVASSAAGASGVGRLVTLKDADFEVADGYPDPTGWEVRAGNADGLKVGKVDDLLVDPDARRVRYLVVKLDDDIARGGDRKVLIPVGAARLNDDRDRVVVPERDRDFFAALPVYEPGRFSREYEDQLRERYAGAAVPAPEAGRDYYSHEQFDESQLFRGRDREARIPRVEEELAVGRRQVQAGEVDVRKRVETEHVS